MPAISADVDMQATFQALQTAGILRNVNLKAKPDGISLCDGILRDFSNPIVLASVGPTLHDQHNPILNIPRDILNTLVGVAESTFVNTAAQLTALFSNAGVEIGINSSC